MHNLNKIKHLFIILIITFEHINQYLWNPYYLKGFCLNVNVKNKVIPYPFIIILKYPKISQNGPELTNWKRFLNVNVLNGIAGVYYFGVIFAVKTALWLLKPGTRDPRLDPFLGFSIWYFWIPGRVNKINKEQVLSTSWNYCLWYKAVTQLHLHNMLTGGLYF